MLGRLLKYEWKSSGKITLLLNAYILLITLCGIAMIKFGFFNAMAARRAASREDLSLPALIDALLVGAYCISIIAVAIAVVLFHIFRFYRNYYTDEGYLMHTLPVSSAQLILSKGFFAFGAIILTSAILMLSAFSVTYTAAPPAERQELLTQIRTLIPSAAQELDCPPALFVLYMTVLTIVSGAHTIFSFYAALSIGQRFVRHKIIGSIIAYAVMNMAEQILSLILLFLCGWNSMIMEQNYAATITIVRKSFLFSLIVTSFITVVYWFITNYMMKERLNLG